MATLTILVFALIFTTAPLGGSEHVPLSPPLDAQINLLATRIQDVAVRRSQVSTSLGEVRRLAAELDKWEDRERQVEQRIKDLEKMANNRNISTLEKNQINDDIEGLNKKLEYIGKLEGGQVINGSHYSTVDQLREAFKNQSGAAFALGEEYRLLTAGLDNLDRQLDGLIAQLRGPDALKEKLEQMKERAERLEANIRQNTLIIEDDSIWLYNFSHSAEIGGVLSSVEFAQVPRKSVIERETQRYLELVLLTPDEKIDTSELASRIKWHKAESDRIKAVLINETLPKAQEELMDLNIAIEELSRLIERGVRAIPDISGCWIILVGSSDFPVIDVSVGSSEDYEAHLVDTGSLAFFKRGDKLFSVSPIDDFVYVGTEYSFDSTGRQVKVRLRLSVDSGGETMRYRSDEVLSLRRCQQ